MNHYELLGIDPKASREEIRAAYLRLAQQFHPDRQIGEQSSNDADFKRIREAYEVLYDEQQRKLYDRHFGAIPQPRHEANQPTRDHKQPQHAAQEAPLRQPGNTRRDVPDGWVKRGRRGMTVSSRIAFRMAAWTCVITIMLFALPQCRQRLREEFKNAFPSATSGLSNPAATTSQAESKDNSKTSSFTEDLLELIPDAVVVRGNPPGSGLQDAEPVGANSNGVARNELDTEMNVRSQQELPDSLPAALLQQAPDDLRDLEYIDFFFERAPEPAATKSTSRRKLPHWEEAPSGDLRHRSTGFGTPPPFDTAPPLALGTAPLLPSNTPPEIGSNFGVGPGSAIAPSLPPAVPPNLGQSGIPPLGIGGMSPPPISPAGLRPSPNRLPTNRANQKRFSPKRNNRFPGFPSGTGHQPQHSSLSAPAPQTSTGYLNTSSSSSAGTNFVPYRTSPTPPPSRSYDTYDTYDKFDTYDTYDTYDSLNGRSGAGY